jgi:hypothetical protein
MVAEPPEVAELRDLRIDLVDDGQCVLFFDCWPSKLRRCSENLARQFRSA